MSADFSKILDHPDNNEIISKLVTGIKPKDISDWLKLKYAKEDEKHLHISSKMLKDFVDNHLDLYNDIRNDIEITKTGGTTNRKIAQSLLNNKTYQERLNEYIDEDLDIKRLLTSTIFIIRDRMEQLFDKIQENPSNTKPDYALLKYLEVLSNYLDKYDKIVLGSPDQVIQHNVTIQKVEENTALFQEVIQEVLAQVDPEMAFSFMEKFTNRMSKLQEPTIPMALPQSKRREEAEMLSTKIKELE